MIRLIYRKYRGRVMFYTSKTGKCSVGELNWYLAVSEFAIIMKATNMLHYP